MNAVVTGAGSPRGIGRTIAKQLVEQGWNVAILDVNFHSVHETAIDLRSLRSDTVVKDYTCDVTSESDVIRTRQEVLEEIGTIHALVNNAGVTMPTPFLEIDVPEWNHIFDVNVLGTFLMTQAFLPSMIDEGWGRIVNISSVSAKRGGGIFGGVHYSASKGAVLGFTRAIAREFAKFGVLCNAVCPGLIDTDITGPNLSQERREQLEREIPVGRMGRADEVANVVAFLCSEQASYVTGEVMDINGGSHID